MSETPKRSPLLNRILFHHLIHPGAVRRMLSPITRFGRRLSVGSLGRSGWEYLLTSKHYVFAILVVFVVVFLFSTAWMLRQLEKNATHAVHTYVSMLVALASRDEQYVMNAVYNIVGKGDFPLISTYRDGTIEAWNGISGIPSSEDIPSKMPALDRQEILRILKAKVREMDEQNEPITFEIKEHPGTYRQIHYGPPKVVRPWAPAAVMGAAFLFIALGFLGFRNIKNGEQQYIWMGMAKETAHQLGTPLSSLSGWIELMHAELEEHSDRESRRSLQRFDEVLGEMGNDMRRLNRVVSRFSRIGSLPEQQPANVTEVISDTLAYFRHRMPQLGRRIEIQETYEEVPPVPMDRELLEWVFENLLRNAMDAMDKAEGRIEIRVQPRSDGRIVDIEFEDNGRGMGPKERRKAFLPGYTTKQRGWGLGLAFVKRIVEEYHRGQVYIKDSAPREGTTIQLLLPTV